MARLHPTSYQLPPIVHRDAQGNYIPLRSSEHYKAFEKLCAEHDMVYFGVADGQACYIVKSQKPLVLQHVDFCDGYHAQPALIRGLRLADVERQVRQERMIFKSTPIPSQSFFK